MKTTLILTFILLLLSFHSRAQQTIDKINTNQLKLPKESVSKALLLDSTGQVKSSSSITDTELSYLDGLTDTLVNLLSGKEPTISSGLTSQYYRGDKSFQTLDKNAVGLSNIDNTSDINKPISSATQTALNLKADDSVVVKLSGNQSISGVKTFTGKIVASTTINGSIPCPVMTQTQRNAFTAAQGDCVYNTTSLQLNIYDGSVWKSAGGSGGISLWITGTVYAVNDVVIQSDKIYRCLVAHTSGTFATDLSAGNWTEVSASPSTPYSLANGGTNKALTAANGGIVWVDSDSFEILTAGTSGQVLQSNAAASPTWVNKSISAKAGSNASITIEEIQVNNNLLTSTASNKHYIELSNKNILANPGFEHSTFSTGWTNSAGTFTEETSLQIDGLKAAKLVLSSQTMSLTQSSTLYASQFADGVQGLASVRVKSSVALKVCSIQAGTVSTTNCVDVPATSKWNLFKVPFIFGSISQGISISSSGAVSGTVYIDDAFVGAADIKSDGMIVKNQASTATGALGAGVAFTGSYTTTGSSIYSDASGVITVTKRASFNIAFSLASSTTTTVVPEIRISSVAVSGDNSPVVAGQKASSSYNAILDPGATISFANSGPGAATSSNISVTATAIESNSIYTSANSDTDWASCGLTGAAFTGFGSSVPTPSLQCKRQGSDLLIKGTFTAGTTPTAVEARMALPIWNGVQLVSANSSIIPSLQLSGNVTANVNSTTFFGNYVLIEPSISYLTFSQQGSTQNAYTKATGTQVSISGTQFSINARIPIEGWQGSNIIVGSFSGLQNCTSTLACTDTFSAKVSSAGVVSDENVDWISGNASSGGTGIKTISFVTGVYSVTPNCVLTAEGASSAVQGLTAEITTISNTSLTYETQSTSGDTDYAIHIICQKQGVDYVGKTALAVASDQNIRTPGVSKAVFYSAKISSAGTVSDEYGDFLSGSCSCATGNYTCTFNTNTFASTPNCGVPSPGSTADRSVYSVVESTSSVTFRMSNSANTGQCLAVEIFCHGVSP